MKCIICKNDHDEDYGIETEIGFVCFDDGCLATSVSKLDKKYKNESKEYRELTDKYNEIHIIATQNRIQINSLTALLKEAGEALGPLEYWSKYVFEKDNEVTLKLQATDFRRAAEIRKKIQEVVG